MAGNLKNPGVKGTGRPLVRKERRVRRPEAFDPVLDSDSTALYGS